MKKAIEEPHNALDHGHRDQISIAISIFPIGFVGSIEIVEGHYIDAFILRYVTTSDDVAAQTRLSR